MKYLAPSIVLIGVLVACNSNKDEKVEVSQPMANIEVKSVGELTIGYYDLEKIPTEFIFYKETQLSLESEGASLEKELMRWQEEGTRAQNQLQQGAQAQTLTDNQMITLQNKIRDCETKIMQIQRDKLEPFQQKSFELNQVLANKLDAYGREFSQNNGLKLFLSYQMGGGVTYIDSSFNMTDEFITFMNDKEKALNNN
ncbi:OmpH family outer membrane protein [Crocinitomicaceae bacterium]|nr:OmpH family outer membrane protein [Crocinitomicaceae bacterium]